MPRWTTESAHKQGSASDWMGLRFGSLSAVSGPYQFAAGNDYPRTHVDVVCDCGAKKTYRCQALKAGRATSCGCKNINRGGARKHGVHSRNPALAKVWMSMRTRCRNEKAPGYARYGGRGISVDARWDDPVTFESWALASGYAPGLQIDRIDNDGPYSPENCRWVTGKQNMRNQERTIMLTAFGEIKSLADWCEDARCIVSYQTLIARIKRYAWSHEKAITTERFKQCIKTA